MSREATLEALLRKVRPRVCATGCKGADPKDWQRAEHWDSCVALKIDAALTPEPATVKGGLTVAAPRVEPRRPQVGDSQAYTHGLIDGHVAAFERGAEVARMRRDEVTIDGPDAQSAVTALDLLATELTEEARLAGERASPAAPAVDRELARKLLRPTPDELKAADAFLDAAAAPAVAAPAAPRKCVCDRPLAENCRFGDYSMDGAGKCNCPCHERSNAPPLPLDTLHAPGVGRQIIERVRAQCPGGASSTIDGRDWCSACGFEAHPAAAVDALHAEGEAPRGDMALFLSREVEAQRKGAQRERERAERAEAALTDARAQLEELRESYDADTHAAWMADAMRDALQARLDVAVKALEDYAENAHGLLRRYDMRHAQPTLADCTASSCKAARAALAAARGTP